MAAVDAANQRVYRRNEIVSVYVGQRGWYDQGERVALLSVAPLVRAKPTLDVGIGSGRTASMLRLLTDSYVGVDYSPEMVTATQRSYPDLDVRLGDARDLCDFRDGQFAFVLFSNHGIDSMSHDGRRRVLRELGRVLGRDGVLVFSTLNKAGRSYRERPWQTHRPGQPADLGPANVALWVWKGVNDPGRFLRRYRNGVSRGSERKLAVGTR